MNAPMVQPCPQPQEDTTSTPQTTVKLLYRVPEAMHILSLSRSQIYELMRSGRLRSVAEGTSRRIPASALTEYVQLLEAEALKEAC